MRTEARRTLLNHLVACVAQHPEPRQWVRLGLERKQHLVPWRHRRHFILSPRCPVNAGRAKALLTPAVV